MQEPSVTRAAPLSRANEKAGDAATGAVAAAQAATPFAAKPVAGTGIVDGEAAAEPESLSVYDKLSPYFSGYIGFEMGKIQGVANVLNSATDAVICAPNLPIGFLNAYGSAFNIGSRAAAGKGAPTASMIPYLEGLGSRRSARQRLLYDRIAQRFRRR
jgi:hypothetical protein